MDALVSIRREMYPELLSENRANQSGSELTITPCLPPAVRGSTYAFRLYIR